MVVRWCPQQKVVAHRAVSAFSLRVALRLELDDGGCQERHAVPVLALLRRPVPGPDRNYITDMWRTGLAVSPDAGEDVQGGAEVLGGAGRRRR